MLACSRKLALFIGFSLFLSGPAQAELGGGQTSVINDAQRLNARLTGTAMPGYVHHVLIRPNGGSVHELTNANGAVFAVTWSGPGRPDLRTLLGRYFDTFQARAAASARAMRSLRRPPQASQSDVQIQTSGHMGWFRGIAFIPSLAPAGFSSNDLPQEP